MDEDNGSRRVFDFSVVTLILRLSLGVLFFFAGLGKFLGGYGNFVSGMTEAVSNPPRRGGQSRLWATVRCGPRCPAPRNAQNRDSPRRY
jgi:hypothetical protein